MRLLPYGPLGWLVELPDHDVLGYARAVERGGHPDVAELVPGARTVLVHIRPGASAAAVGAWLDTIAPEAIVAHDRRTDVEIPVTYDGEDLEAVATACGLTVAEVVSRHTAAQYVCAFCGFAPGFGYLAGLDAALHLPRRPSPRTRVPAGSVAIADAYSAVYPSASPGGWHLIGRTEIPMWDAARRPPALLAPGTAVRFVAAS
jgi:KipI family sensor histidine kinase inhibitor